MRKHVKKLIKSVKVDADLVEAEVDQIEMRHQDPKVKAAFLFRQLVMCLPRTIRIISAENIAFIRRQLEDVNGVADLLVDGRSKAARSVLRPYDPAPKQPRY